MGMLEVDIAQDPSDFERILNITRNGLESIKESAHQVVWQVVLNFYKISPDLTVNLVDTMLINPLHEALWLRGLETSGWKPVLIDCLKQYFLDEEKSEGDWQT